MTSTSVPALVDAIVDTAKGQDRILVAIAGPPGSGKSTFAADLSNRLGETSAVVPMDGFHFDNDHLNQLGLFDRKGSPNTFDVAGLEALIQSLKTTPSVPYPTFDRASDSTVPNGGMVYENARILLIEGNYLLLDAEGWSDLAPYFDLKVRLSVDRNVLKARLVERWIKHGLSPQAAKERAMSNDMKNVDVVDQNSITADFVVETDW